MEEYDIETESIADLCVALSDESNIDDEVVDARLAAGSVVRYIARSALGIVTARAPAAS